MGLHADWEAAKEWLAGIEAEVEAFIKAKEDEYRAWWIHHHGGEVPAENIAVVRAQALEDLKAKEGPQAPEPAHDATPASSAPAVDDPGKPAEAPKDEKSKEDKPAKDKAEK